MEPSVQRRPFHDAATGTPSRVPAPRDPVVDSRLPTATHDDPDEHATASNALSAIREGLGTGRSVQLEPSHDPESGSPRSDRSVCQPTAMQDDGVGHATPPNPLPTAEDPVGRERAVQNPLPATTSSAAIAAPRRMCPRAISRTGDQTVRADKHHRGSSFDRSGGSRRDDAAVEGEERIDDRPAMGVTHVQRPDHRGPPSAV